MLHLINIYVKVWVSWCKPKYWWKVCNDTYCMMSYGIRRQLPWYLFNCKMLMLCDQIHTFPYLIRCRVFYFYWHSDNIQSQNFSVVLLESIFLFSFPKCDLFPVLIRNWLATTDTVGQRHVFSQEYLKKLDSSLINIHFHISRTEVFPLLLGCNEGLVCLTYFYVLDIYI